MNLRVDIGIEFGSQGRQPRPATKGAIPPWNPLERFPVASHGAYEPLVDFSAARVCPAQRFSHGSLTKRKAYGIGYCAVMENIFALMEVIV
jgi:hypothetical protein